MFVFDRWHATQERVSVDSNGAQGDGDVDVNSGVSLSANGRFVVFASLATLAGDAFPWQQDVFVRDRDLDEDESHFLGSMDDLWIFRRPLDSEELMTLAERRGP